MGGLFLDDLGTSLRHFAKLQVVELQAAPDQRVKETILRREAVGLDVREIGTLDVHFIIGAVRDEFKPGCCSDQFKRI